MTTIRSSARKLRRSPYRVERSLVDNVDVAACGHLVYRMSAFDPKPTFGKRVCDAMKFGDR